MFIEILLFRHIESLISRRLVLDPSALRLSCASLISRRVNISRSGLKSSLTLLNCDALGITHRAAPKGLTWEVALIRG